MTKHASSRENKIRKKAEKLFAQLANMDGEVYQFSVQLMVSFALEHEKSLLRALKKMAFKGATGGDVVYLRDILKIFGVEDYKCFGIRQGEK